MTAPAQARPYAPHPGHSKDLSAPFDAVHCAEALSLLCEPDDVVEVRIPKSKKGVISGYYNDLDRLVVDVAPLSGKVPGVYITMNRVDRHLLDRSPNRLRHYAKPTTSDTDILSIRWLLVDFDPKRPADTSSTDAEHEAALGKACEVREYLRAQGWPEPIYADSGNGGHLLYRISLPKNKDSRQLIDGCLNALAFKFDDDTVAVDESVGNPARLLKLYGSLACKGESTPDRPHRLARIVNTPRGQRPVSERELQKLVTNDGCSSQQPASAVGAAIEKGQRNATLMSLAGSMQQRGMASEAILAALLAENGAKSNPPLSEAEVQTIADSVSRYEPGQDTAVEWPELVSLDSPELPRLDLSCLPGWAGDYAAALATSTETPPELAAALVLSSCSVAAARRIRVQVRPGYIEPCNMWLIAALPSGNRKSAVQSAATAPLVSWERETADEMKPEISRIGSELKTQEARVKALRNSAAKQKNRVEAVKDAKEAADIEKDMVEVPRPPQLWTSDSTPERMGILLADNEEHMAWLSAEGGVFDLLQGRYSGGIPNLDLMLKGWSGDSERVDRAGRPSVYLQYPLITFGLSPQPDVLRGLAAVPGFRGRGLIARFLYLLPPSPLGYRTLDAAPIPDGVRNAYHTGLRAMLNWPLPAAADDEVCLHQLELAPDSYAEKMDFEQRMEISMRPGGDFEHAMDWASKAAGAAVRLAGVLHGIKHAHGEPWKVRIESDTMSSALEIMAVIARHSLAALDLMGADEGVAAARRVWEWAVGGRRASFTVRKAHQALKGTFPRVKELRDAIGVLEERGYVEVDTPAKDGRGRPPSPEVTVRPDIAEGWR